MRVISGKARGTKINSIDDITTRPTLDRVKESLFNILQERIEGAKVLDLFAGSGALGIEALSRNANYAVFCDNNKKAINIIKDNLERTRLLEKSIMMNMDYKKCIELLSKKKSKFDLIFLDPPYKADIAVEAVKLIVETNILSTNGIIMIETDEIDRDLKQLSDIELQGIKIYDKRKYGRANLIFLS